MRKDTKRAFFSEYDLNDARKLTLKKPAKSAAHQKMAIDSLIKWYKSNVDNYAGGILVLPTGGGKTYTALRFLCLTALSDNYKVLWLAHTHHLLEQAYHSFKDHVGVIAEPKSKLRVRVVSGTIGHFRIAEIKPDDDVVIATLQTITRGYCENHVSLNSFIDSAKGKLLVVFDEAHHAPAPSYRKLLTSLRDRCKDMRLLGLTATPVYSNQNLQGWLNKLFPQGILYQVTPQTLMAQGILAKPVTEQQKTNFTPHFDLREYQKWAGTFRDIPDDIITQLAENKDRNMFIANCYISNKDRYGKTLIFADRWFQCEAISEQLSKHKIRVGTVYSHIDGAPRTADARNKRTSDENAKVLDAFREGKLDVILNVRMLTEGTDLPDVKTCFITRQTTSKILLTQMIGRGLRGPKFGGTPEAIFVFFTDNWEPLINWAEYDMIDGMAGDDGAKELGKRPPLRNISIELVRKLAAQIDRGVNINPEPFMVMLPVGWYGVEYTAKQSDSEDIEYIRRLVMVFEHEREGYVRLVKELRTNTKVKADFYDEDVQLEDVSPTIAKFQSTFFPATQNHFGSNLSQDIFSIARHIAQNNTEPKFFKFEERKSHDLDLIAEEFLDKKLSREDEDEALLFEFDRRDRYWQVLYITYDLFKSQYNGCVERSLYLRRHGANPKEDIHIEIHYPPPREPSDDVKKQVKERDGKCLCCGSTYSRNLVVDHINSIYNGGGHIFDNLQTLCSECNQLKGTSYINFRDCQTDLTMPPNKLSIFKTPTGKKAGTPESWTEFLRRVINFFYRCSAVHDITIGKRGDSFYNWHIELNAGNDPRWLQPHLNELLNSIVKAKETGGYAIPKTITVNAPDFSDATFSSQ